MSNNHNGGGYLINTVEVTISDYDRLLDALVNKSEFTLTQAQWNKLSNVKKGDEIQINTGVIALDNIHLKVERKYESTVSGQTVKNILVRGDGEYSGTLIPIEGVLMHTDETGPLWILHSTMLDNN